MSYRVGMDIGGTFTDFVVVDEAGAADHRAARCSSTPANPARGRPRRARAVRRRTSAQIGFLVHGTTVGLNAFLERKGTRVLLLMTAGLRRRVLDRRGTTARSSTTLQYRQAASGSSRAATCFEVVERLRWDGTVETPLDESSLRPIVEKVARGGHRGGRGLPRARLCQPGRTSCACASSCCRECRRALGHALARDRPRVARVRARLLGRAERVRRAAGRALPRHARGGARRGSGSRRTLHVMQSSGGMMTARDGPRAAGPDAPLRPGRRHDRRRRALARRPARPNLLCIDMGGTSFDLSLIVDGRPSVSTETELEGLPLLMPLVDIHTIGAGGGSLAWLEAGGLRVGPQSAGADPGPACYGRGGHRADGHRREPLPRPARPGLLPRRPDGARPRRRPRALSLGRLAGRARRRRRSPRGCWRSSTRRWRTRCGRSPSSSGIDPRDFSLVAFGGAGPMHAAWLARGARDRRGDRPVEPRARSRPGGCSRPTSGTTSSSSFYQPLAELDAAEPSRDAFAELEGEGAALARRPRASRADDRYFARSADMRYVGQEYSVNVPVGGDGRTSTTSSAGSTRRTTSATGTRRRARRSSSSTSASPRMGGVGARRRRRSARPAARSDPVARHAASRLRRAAAHETPVLRRDRLAARRARTRARS